MDDSERRMDSPWSWGAAICRARSSGGLVCGLPSHTSSVLHDWDAEAGQEQPLPVPNDGPSMHDLVVKDILSRDPRWDLSVGSARHLRDRVADDLLERKMVGQQRYGTVLQAHNGRDFLRDAYEEAQDLSVYLRGCLAEMEESSLEWVALYDLYEQAVTSLVTFRRVRDAVPDRRTVTE